MTYVNFHRCYADEEADEEAGKKTFRASSLLTLFAFVAFGLASQMTPAASSIYQWMDDRGVMHYSDRPGAPEADTFNPDSEWLSVVKTVATQKNIPRSPYVEDELRWQRQGRDAQRRETERDMAKKEKLCTALRKKWDAANEARSRERARKLEQQWFSTCR